MLDNLRQIYTLEVPAPKILHQKFGLQDSQQRYGLPKPTVVRNLCDIEQGDEVYPNMVGKLFWARFRKE